MATIIQRIQEQLGEKSLVPGTSLAHKWLLQKVKQLNPTGQDRMQLLKQRDAQRNKAIIGRFYFFHYEPKLKEVLPYWDRFPLVIPIKQYTDGFLGLNLHYISPKDRLILLKQLSRFATGSLQDERTRLKPSYPLLSATHQAYRATPCVKRYLLQHIRTRVIEIPTPEWDIAAALPLQQFTSKTSIRPQEVWEESKEKF